MTITATTSKGATAQRTIREQRARTRLTHEVRELAPGEREVDRHVHEPGLLNAEPQQHVRIGVLSERSDPVAFDEPDRVQRVRDSRARVVELAIRPRPIDRI